jgi:two-component system NtrC family sensor kinase
MKLSIASKINLFAMFMIVTAVVILGWIFVRHETRAIRTELDERANTIVNNLAYNSEYGVLVGDKESLQRLLEGIMKEKDMMYVLIENKKGEIIAWSGEKRTEPIKEFTAPILTKPMPEGKEEFGFSPEMNEKEEVIGLAKLRVSLSSLHRKTMELQIFIIGVTIIVILLSFLGTFLGIRFFITRPFRPLISGIERIVRGDLSHRVEVKSKDEIGEFASSFNQMTQALKESKEELEEYSRTLEQKVEQRTKQLKLAQQQIIQQEKMASVGQLAAGVAHELNNPLGGILGYSQLALERVSKTSVKNLNENDLTTYSQYLKDIVQQSQRSKKIVQQLLKFARASTKEVFRPVDIDALLRETLSFTRHHLEMGNIKLINNLSPSLPEIMGNATQLQQVFTNIILNSLQAMPQGGELRVSTKMVDDKSQKMIQITFSDTGCGIPQENLNKVFEPFFTTKEVGEGTGLGLSVSYGIIKDHKGEILVESEVGKGSTFVIFIPVPLKKKHS